MKDVRSEVLRPTDRNNAPDAPIATGRGAGVVLWRGFGREGLGAGVWLRAGMLEGPGASAGTLGFEDTTFGFDEVAPAGAPGSLASGFELVAYEPGVSISK